MQEIARAGFGMEDSPAQWPTVSGEQRQRVFKTPSVGAAGQAIDDAAIAVSDRVPGRSHLRAGEWQYIKCHDD